MHLKKYLMENQKKKKEHAKKYSQKWLAEKIGASPTTVGAYSNGKQSPHLLKAMKLMHLFGDELTLFDLLSDKDKKDFKKWLQENS